MGCFFTDTTSAPRIPLRKTFRKRHFYIIAGGTVSTLQQTVTTSVVEHIGLTQAAADSIAEAKQDTDVQAVSTRMNDAGMYKVTVTTDSKGPWS